MARIAFVLPDMGGGGAERVALALIEAFVARGHDIDLVMLKEEGVLLALLPPAVRRFDLDASGLLGALMPLRRYLRSEKPDAVQALMWPLTIVAILAHRLARSKARLMVADHTTLSRHYDKGWLPRLLRVTTRLFYPMAHSRVIVSERAADDLARLSGLDRGSIEVIYNPIVWPSSSAARAEAEPPWRGDGESRILTVGSLSVVKNQSLLVRAFARIARRRPARLVILGEGPERAALVRIAEEEGVADRVHLPGFARDPWPYYQSANLFVLSSDYEGFSNVLVEAMAAGLPVVSTDCESGPAEVLAGGLYGALVSCGDVEALTVAIDRALDAEHDRAALRRRAEALSGSSVIDRYLALLVPTESDAATAQ